MGQRIAMARGAPSPMTPAIPAKLSEYLANVCTCYAADKKPERVQCGALWLTVCGACSKPIRPRT